MKKYLPLLLLFALTCTLHAQQLADGDTSIYERVDEMPRFIGCEDRPMVEREDCARKVMMEYLYGRMSLRELANNETGEPSGLLKSVIQIRIEKDGQITEAKAIWSEYDKLDETAIKTILNMPPWIPARKAGEAVPCYYIIPVRIHIQ